MTEASRPSFSLLSPCCSAFLGTIEIERGEELRLARCCPACDRLQQITVRWAGSMPRSEIRSKGSDVEIRRALQLA